MADSTQFTGVAEAKQLPDGARVRSEQTRVRSGRQNDRTQWRHVQPVKAETLMVLVLGGDGRELDRVAIPMVAGGVLLSRHQVMTTSRPSIMPEAKAVADGTD